MSLKIAGIAIVLLIFSSSGIFLLGSHNAYPESPLFIEPSAIYVYNKYDYQTLNWLDAKLQTDPNYYLLISGRYAAFVRYFLEDYDFGYSPNVVFENLYDSKTCDPQGHKMLLVIDYYDKNSVAFLPNRRYTKLNISSLIKPEYNLTYNAEYFWVYEFFSGGSGLIDDENWTNWFPRQYLSGEISYQIDTTRVINGSSSMKLTYNFTTNPGAVFLRQSFLITQNLSSYQRIHFWVYGDLSLNRFILNYGRYNDFFVSDMIIDWLGWKEINCYINQSAKYGNPMLDQIDWIEFGIDNYKDISSNINIDSIQIL